MKERPILFSGAMVRAILRDENPKTQTRRVIALPRKRDSFVLEDHGHGWWPFESDDGESSNCNDGCEHPYTCPYGQPGDRLWVREKHFLQVDAKKPRATVIYQDDSPWGVFDLTNEQWEKVRNRRRDFSENHTRLCPSIHMPRWASRIDLELTAVRVERLQDINHDDARAEGIINSATFYGKNNTWIGNKGDGFLSPKEAYRALWESINGAGSWDANPWVWVLEFKRLELANKEPS